MKRKSKIKLEDLKIQSFSTSQGLSREATFKIVGGTQELHGECTTYTHGCFCDTNGADCSNGYAGCGDPTPTATTCPTYESACCTIHSQCCTGTCATGSAANSGCSCVYC